MNDIAQNLRADRARLYRASGCVQAGFEGNVAREKFSLLLRRLLAAGVRFSTEKGQIVWWAPSHQPRELIDEIHSARARLVPMFRDWSVEHRHGTDQFCELCGSNASTEWRDGVDGDLVWRCDDCGPPEILAAPKTPKRRSPPNVSAPVHEIGLKVVPRPDEPPRDRWWDAPVHGWRDGLITITSMAGDMTIEINFNEEVENG